MRLCDVTAPALVLGSTQPEDHVDAPAAGRAGLEVVRRRTGGGAVLVRPGEMVWADVVVPAGDPLWQEDVGRAFLWLGQAWADALAAVGVEGAAVHGGGLVGSTWSSLVCFAGLGAGEVTVKGRKVVGMAQRRTRHGAVFQCAVPLCWDPAALVGVLSLSPPQREAAVAELTDAVRPVTGVAVDDLEAALVDGLGRVGGY